MTLSIIIVNFNVKYFLEQCLCSVKKAIEKIEAEVFVVDNNSSDGSMNYLKPKFPFVEFIINNENSGFSKANNKALAIARGKYILFLNPDTIVAEDSFEQCLYFMNTRPEVGATGVKMIDGSGNYLKESKRGFPSLWISFCKLSGLAALFPRSKFFAGYYLGFLSEKENQQIDVISGAFMFVRRDILDQIGGFDERFFMYAEDIDLSFRIQQAGYMNYYLAETIIIHFKGESTAKDFHHLKLFYKAMSLFARKHLGGKKSFVLILFVEAAIRFRAALSVLRSFLNKKQSIKPPPRQQAFLLGDKETTEALEKLLSSKGIITSKKNSEELCIIFCEGFTFPFKKIIEMTQQENKNYKFHSYNSKSIVGSNKKNASGDAIELDP